MEAYGQVKGRRHPSVHGGTTDPAYVKCTRCGAVMTKDRFGRRKGRTVQPCLACAKRAEKEAARKAASEKRRRLAENPSRKRCEACGEEYPIVDFFRSRNGVGDVCRKCRSAKREKERGRA